MYNLIERIFKIDSRYFLGGGFWLLTAQGLTILISLLGTIVFAHFLTETEFGLYRYLVNLAVLFGSFTLTGIGQAIFQAAAKHDTWYYAYAQKRLRRYNLIASSIALSVAFYYFYQDNYVLASGCVLIALLQPSSIHFLNALAFLQGQTKFKEATYLQTTRSLFITTLSISTVLITQDVLTLIAVFLGAQAVTGYLSWKQTKVETITQVDTQKTSLYNSIANHTSIRNIIIGTAAKLDSIIVFQQLGAASLATFTIATLLPDHLKGAIKNLPTLLIPRFSSKAAHEQPHLTLRSIQSFIILGVITGLCIPIVPFVYGILFPKYPDAIFYTQLLILAVPASVYHIYLSWLQTHSYEKALYIINVTTSLFLIVSAFVGALTLGLLGVVLSRIATQYILLAITLIVTMTLRK